MCAKSRRAKLVLLGRDGDTAFIFSVPRHEPLTLLDRCIVMAPAFAEVWNRRAAIHFADQDFVTAMADLNRALAIDPRHFKALEGAAFTLKEMGRKKLALEQFRRLMAINPFSTDGKRGLEELERELEGQKI
jgi:tetratricopeptide (TPR) repeat protein